MKIQRKASENLPCLNTEQYYEIMYFILHDFTSHLIMLNAHLKIMLSNRNAGFIFMKL